MKYMKSIYNYLTGLLCLVAVLWTAGSCSDEYEYSTDYSFYKDAKLKVDLVDENNTLHLKLASNTHQITVGVTPEDVLIDIAAYIYKVADETIATVDDEGVLTLLKAGETELTVKFRGNQEIATNCTIKITRDPVPVTGLKVPNEVAVQERKTFNLAEKVTVLPGNADDPALLYTIADETIATVDENGIVTGVKEGTTTLTVTSVANPEVTKTVPVNVVSDIKVTEIKLNAAAKLNGKTVAVGQIFNLGSVIKVMPENASNKTLTYTVEGDAGVLSVDADGVVETLADGTAKVKISATDESGIQAEVELTVDHTVTVFERTLWTVETSALYEETGLNYMKDGSTGLPEHIIDGKAGTFLSLLKPGKTYGGCTAPADAKLFFVVDMGGETEFNHVVFQQRKLNSNVAPLSISISGSNDGRNFVDIKTNVATPYTNANPYDVDVDLVKYRYVKVEYLTWGASGNTAQTAEFNVGKK